MQREEAFTIINRYHEDRNWYIAQLSLYCYTHEYQSATQKDKLKQRMKGMYTEKLIDDILHGKEEYNHLSEESIQLMRLRNEFLWQRNLIISKIVSFGFHPLAQDIDMINFNVIEICGDIYSIIKNLQIIECICIRRSSSQSQTIEYDLNKELIDTSSTLLGFSLQYLHILWDLFHSFTNQMKQVFEKYNDSSYHYFNNNSQEVFSHICILLRQVFVTLNVLCSIPGASDRRKTSLNGWCWGYKLRLDPLTGELVSDKELFSDAMMYQEVYFWLMTTCEYKIIQTKKSHEEMLDSEVSFETWIKPYRNIMQRMMYQGSPFINNLLYVIYYLILHDTTHSSNSSNSNDSSDSDEEKEDQLNHIPMNSHYSSSSSNNNESSDSDEVTEEGQLKHIPMNSCLIQMQQQSLVLCEYLLNKYSLLMSSSEYGSIAFHDIEMLKSYDEEVILSFKICSLCFMNGYITNCCLSVLLFGLSFSYNRRDNYEIQINWMNAILLLCLSLHSGSSHSFTGGMIYDTGGNVLPAVNKEQIPSVQVTIHLLIGKKLILSLLEIINSHRYSLTIIYKSLLLLRLLLHPNNGISELSKTDIEYLLILHNFENPQEIINKMNNKFIRMKQQHQHIDLIDEVQSNKTLDIDDVKDVFNEWKYHTFNKEMSIMNDIKGKSSCDSFPSLLKNILDTASQIPEVVEQGLLLFYQLSEVSSFLKIAFIEIGIATTLSNIAYIQRGSIYLLSLCSLCQDIIDKTN